MERYIKFSICVGVIVSVSALFAGSLSAQVFQPTENPGYAVDNGDVNGDLRRNLADPTYLAMYLFNGGEAPVPLALCGTNPTAVENGDSNGDARINIADMKHLASFMFLGTAAPVGPCGEGGGARRNANPRIIPPHAKPHGMSYGDWGLAWWKWALELPRENHPVWDETGADCGVGQSGHVWYLAGTFGGPAERTECVVPKGTMIFLPLLNWSAWSPEDLDWAISLGVPGGTDTEKMQNLLAEFVDQTFDLQVTIDGTKLQNLDIYQGASSGATSVELSDVLAEFGFEPGFRELLVADGHYIMIAPLKPGRHRIEFSSRMDCAGGDECFGEVFAFDVGPIVYDFIVR